MNEAMTSDKGLLLIVDDNTTNLGVLFDYLKAYGYRILVAQSGDAALEILEEKRPDLILLDIMMPGMDGFETCRRIKQQEATRDIAIIFMTAVTETVDKVKGFKLGAVDYITKPIQHEEVLARVKTHVTLQALKRNLIAKNEELASVNRTLESMVEEKNRQLVGQEKLAIIGRMIQGIAHNLKTPLGVIKNSNLVIEKKMERISADASLPSLTDKNRKLLESVPLDTELVSKAHKQIMGIINNLMIKSRMDQNQGVEKIDVNSLIEQEIAFFQANSQFKHKVKKTVQLADDLPAIAIIYTNLAQVVENLIVNALHAMWDHSEQQLHFRTQLVDDAVHVEIQDSGVGIPADKLDKIFDPFYTSKPLKGEGKEGEPTGTGLGLYTCRELLKPFDGTIEVDSVVGEGSTFRVVLPVTPDNSAD